MKSVAAFKLILHPPNAGHDRWDVWVEEYYLAEYDQRSVVSGLNFLIRRTLEKALS